MKSAALLIWLATKKTAELPWGVQLSFPPWWGQAGEQELCQKSCLQIFRQASKNFLEKAPHEKSKILIKGGVSKFRYFQHACQSGPKINHSRSIHLSALPKHLGDWCLFGIVIFITNIFHRGVYIYIYVCAQFRSIALHIIQSL